MGNTQIGGIVRAFVAAVVGYAAGKGLIVSSEISEAVITIMTTIFVSVWSVKSKQN